VTDRLPGAAQGRKGQMQQHEGIAGIALMIAAATLMTPTPKLDRHGPKLF
jgi:hypothetical protein